MGEIPDRCVRCQGTFEIECLWACWQEIARTSVARSFPRGALLAMEGSPIGAVHLIRAGRLKLSKTLEDGRELIVGFRGAGAHLGLAGLYVENQACNAEAVEPTSTCAIRRPDFIRLVREDPKVAQAVVEQLAIELGRARERLRDVALKTARERVASHLLSLVARPTASCRSAVVELESSRQDVSRMIGLRTETLFRVLTDFHEERLIRIRPRSRAIELTDPDGLERLSR